MRKNFESDIRSFHSGHQCDGELKAYTEALSFSETRYRMLFEKSLDPSWVQNASGTVVIANRAAADLFECALPELIGADTARLFSQRGFTLPHELRDELLAGQTKQYSCMQKITNGDGHERYISLTASLISSSDHSADIYFTGKDITNEMRMQENQHFYMQQVTQALEEERQRISRDLHDSAAQNLIGVLHQLESFCKTDEYLPMSKLRSLWNLHERLKDLLQEIRHLSRDLRPSILDHLGLLAAVDWLAEQMNIEHKIEVDLTVSGSQRRYSPEVEVTLFRIVQEGLRNIARHSEATKAEIIIDFKDAETCISITDNGKGSMLPSNLGELPRLGKLGLDGIQTRVKLVGGSFDIQSTPRKGTTIAISIPV